MLRPDPGDSRIRAARQFKVWEGGGEYNVARGLRRCFDQRTALVSAFVDNEVGRLLEDLILQGGVDISHVRWMPFDGVSGAGPVMGSISQREVSVYAGQKFVPIEVRPLYHS